MSTPTPADIAAAVKFKRIQFYTEGSTLHCIDLTTDIDLEIGRERNTRTEPDKDKWRGCFCNKCRYYNEVNCTNPSSPLYGKMVFYCDRKEKAHARTV